MKPFSGIITALATPFDQNSLDLKSFDNLLSYQIEQNIEGFVVNGTTGESPTLKSNEVEELFSIAKKKVQSKIPIIVGTGSNCTEKTIYDSREAEKWGADALLVVVPYYNKPPSRGLYQHFKIIAESVQVPIILYNVPGRTITSLDVETILKLSEIKNIIGIKEASGRVSMAIEIRRACSEDFLLLSGDDGTFVDFLGAGGDGVISVASHLIPSQMKNWQTWVKSGNINKAKEDLKKYLNWIDLLFCEANPIPLKRALQMKGLFASAELRLPLVELEEEMTFKLKNEMQRIGIL